MGDVTACGQRRVVIISGHQRHARAGQLPHSPHALHRIGVRFSSGRQNHLPARKECRDRGINTAMLAARNRMSGDKFAIRWLHSIDDNAFDTGKIGHDRLATGTGQRDDLWQQFHRRLRRSTNDNHVGVSDHRLKIKAIPVNEPQCFPALQRGLPRAPPQ